MHQAEGEITSSAGRTTVAGDIAATLPAASVPPGLAGRSPADQLASFSDWTRSMYNGLKSDMGNVAGDVVELREQIVGFGGTLDAMAERQDRSDDLTRAMANDLKCLLQEKRNILHALRESCDDPERQRERSLAAVMRQVEDDSRMSAGRTGSGDSARQAELDAAAAAKEKQRKRNAKAAREAEKLAELNAAQAKQKAKSDRAERRAARMAEMAEGALGSDASMDSATSDSSESSGRAPSASGRSPPPSEEALRVLEEQRVRRERAADQQAAYDEYVTFQVGGALTAANLAERGRKRQAIVPRCAEQPTERACIMHFMRALRARRQGDGVEFASRLDVKHGETPFPTFTDFMEFVVKTAPAVETDTRRGGEGS